MRLHTQGWTHACTSMLLIYMTFIRVLVYDVTCLLFTFWVLHSVLLWLMHVAYDNSLSR